MLVDLLAEAGTITVTEAASRLGYSSGLCSFHLRQLAGAPDHNVNVVERHAVEVTTVSERLGSFTSG